MVVLLKEVSSATWTEIVEVASPSANSQVKLPLLPVMLGVPTIEPATPQSGDPAAKVNDVESTSAMLNEYVA